MAYKKKTYTFKNAIEVVECHNGRYGAPGEKRQKKKKPTPEQIEKRNQYNKERTCLRRMREHFNVNDYFFTLSYEKDKRPNDIDGAKKDFSNFTRELRKIFHKLGIPMKWIRNIEVGSKGAWHIHVVMNRITDLDIYIRKLWKKGMVHFKMLDARHEFEELAKYMTKSEKTDSRLRETSYSTSKNIPIQEPEIKPIHWKTWRKIKIPEGFYLDPDLFHEGINPCTGYKYRTYTLLRIVRRE
ncbi:MAG: hypothetical protein R3Y58_07330 [Eubacteriales bacterium]